MPNLLKSRGLISYRNELNVPDGAMDVADNIVIDEDDVVELRRGQGEYGDALPNEEDRVKQVAEYKTLLFRHYNSTLQFDNGSGVFSDFSGSYQELEDGLRIKYLEANGNFYFTDITGIKKISAKTTAQVTASSIEDAGVPRAVSLEASVKYAVGGFLPPQSKCAYRVLWGKKDNNSNLLLGYPSERFVLTNTADTVEVQETYVITVNAGQVPSNDDVITLGDLTTQYFLWFDKTGTDEAPETSRTLGRTAVKVALLDPGENDTSSASKIANAIANIGSFNVTLSSTNITVQMREAGDVENPEAYNGESLSGTVFSIDDQEQGSITEGDSANAEVSFSVPAGIDNTYFYQVYRTSPVTVPEGLNLDDIDPGDEMNLVFEGNPLDPSGNLLSEVTIQDITPEDFRASAVFLYTNPISGEGILQANARPPVAKDITLFNGSNFFANTKTTHKFTVNLVSVLNMTSGLSDFIVGNGDITRKYVAVGATQVQDVEILSTALADKAWFVNSARNEREYFIWYDEDGNGTKPSIAEFDNKIGVRVRYDSVGDTTDDIATKTASALAATGDFQISVVGSVMTLTLAKNGVTSEAVESSLITDGVEMSFSVPSTLGDGEDTAAGEFLLSNQISVAASIDESARSLVKVINADPLSEVNAFYLSGADDVPGIILLEARNLEDKPFYIGTSDSNIVNDFDPSLNLENPILSTAPNGDNTDVELSSSNNVFVGQELFLYDDGGSLPFANGKYEVLALAGTTVTIAASSLVPSTNVGAALVASNESDNEETPNRLYFSKSFQPESVPIVNFIDIGPRDKAILRILPLRDNLFALKEDGVYIISGSSAPNFTVRLLDSSVSLLAPDSAVVLNNSIYALSNDGVVRISDTGVEVISRPIENLIKDVVNSRYDYEFSSFGVTYSSDRSYLLWLPTERTDTVATQCYRYNTFTRTWTRFTISATCGLVAIRDDKMYLGSGNSNYLTQERKNGDRTDYADRDFNLSLLPSGVDSNVIRVSSVVEVDEGDVVYQEQYVTISILKRLLRKLDIDKLITSSDYFSSITVEAGIKISLVMDGIVDKLIADGITVTDITTSDDPITQQTQFNNLIDELNDPLSGTGFKDYKKALDMVPYEMVVEKVQTIDNRLTLVYETPFVEGDITIFKGINAKFQYAPQHFGDPSVLKQIRQGTIIFDQNSFYGGVIAYASDQSADFIDTPFSGYGIGDFGTGQWGEGTWGGSGNDIPHRTLIPLEKQRCRYLTVQIRHNIAREIIRINGISLMVRVLSNRAYR
jgi:hypothetical protein